MRNETSVSPNQPAFALHMRFPLLSFPSHCLVFEKSSALTNWIKQMVTDWRCCKCQCTFQSSQFMSGTSLGQSINYSLHQINKRRLYGHLGAIKGSAFHRHNRQFHNVTRHSCKIILKNSRADRNANTLVWRSIGNLWRQCCEAFS